MFELDDLSCPNRHCLGVWNNGEKQKATLEHIKTHDFYKCPVCGTEVWEPPDRDDGKVSTREARSVYKLEQRYKDSIRQHGGGNKKAGRKRDKKKKIAMPWLPE